MWTKANQAAMNRLSSQCQTIVPANVKARAEAQAIPNRSTHIGVLVEWAMANGYRLELVKETAKPVLLK